MKGVLIMMERKYVKFSANMYEDIKLKIIDTMKDRDIIHYILARLITLAGKVNLDGYLYITKNIPYTLDTLAIEFNRSIGEVKIGIDALNELEIVEITEGNIFKVKNWSKHQNPNSKKAIKENPKEVLSNIDMKENNKEKPVKLKNESNKINENKAHENEKAIDTIVLKGDLQKEEKVVLSNSKSNVTYINKSNIEKDKFEINNETDQIFEAKETKATKKKKIPNRKKRNSKIEEISFEEEIIPMFKEDTLEDLGYSSGIEEIAFKDEESDGLGYSDGIQEVTLKYEGDDDFNYMDGIQERNFESGDNRIIKNFEVY